MIIGIPLPMKFGTILTGSFIINRLFIVPLLHSAYRFALLVNIRVHDRPLVLPTVG